MIEQVSCWIVGETTLAIRCAEILLEGRHALHGIASAHPEAVRWARQHDIQVVTDFASLPAALASRPYHYLFSIVNSRILRNDVIATASRGAINYHDGPLPRYAGMHSTSWAILNGESVHGITWHQVAAEVDAGAILEQRRVPIAPDETALTLNAKCYEAAIEAFTALIANLSSGQATPREQDLSERTYYGRWDRPRAAGLISWNGLAGAISALVRALDFGAAYPNPLSRPKVQCGSDMLVCSAVALTSTVSLLAPGTVVRVDEHGITVATGDVDLVIQGLEAMDGTPLNIGAVAARNNLRAEEPLGVVRDEVAERITRLNADISRHEAHWVRALRSVAPLELPFRQTPSGAQPGDAHRIALQIPDTLHHQPAAALTALAGWLARLSDARTVDIGVETPELARTVRGLEQLLATDLPVRLCVELDHTFAEQASAVAAGLASAAARGTFTRDVFSRYPELRGQAQAAPSVGYRVAPRAGAAPPAGDLVLDVMDAGREAALWYRTGVFEERDAQRIARQIETLLRSAAGHPNTPIAELDIVPADERRRLLAEWNATAAPFPRDATVHSLFEEQARRTPDVPALRFGETRMTFAELDRAAERWVRHLRARGVGRDSIVGLRLTRSPHMVVGMLAIMKAGGAYLPLDTSWPAERTRFVLDDAGVDLVLTQKSLADETTAYCLPPTAHCLFLDAKPDELPAAETTPADAESLAYVIYTSGSTGQPKGVLVQHRGVVNYLSWCARAYRADEGEGSPVHSPATFDLTVTSLFAPLIGGRTVHLLDEALGVEALAEALRAHADYTLVKITPSHLEVLRRQLAPEEAAGRTRAFVIGGESLAGPSLAFWQQHAPDTRLINEYGPTETVVGCCVYEVPPDARISGAVPIGRPIANTQLYVLDDRMQLLPAGTPGELFIGGEGVARGYLNRPELTAERFVPDPFGTDPSGRLYRTGDRVRWRRDGNLEFLGRLDGQVKLRGYRIELGEIEAVLASHAAVDQAAAALWRGPGDDQRLVAYYTPVPGASPPRDELRDWLRLRLPDYMVPASLEPIDHVPLTSNGKVDRAALPAPGAQAERRGELAAPRSPLEHRLARIWEEVLGVPVGVTDNFFELGGHSLLAMRMIDLVREETGSAPPLSVLLTRPTIEHVAAALAAGVPASSSTERDLSGAVAAGDEEPMLQVAEGSGTPFFFLHGDFLAGGFYVEALVRQLDPGQPMYAIRPHRPGGPESIEAMAADYVGLVRSVQPAGPYLLGGLCNGGAVAYEMARQLRARGEEVALLALVNTAHRNARLAWLERVVSSVARVLRLDPSRERALFLRVRAGLMVTMNSMPVLSRDAPIPARAGWWARVLARDAWRIAKPRLAALLGRVDAKSVAAAEARLNPPPTDDLTGAFERHRAHDSAERFYLVHKAMSSFVAQPYAGHTTVVWWEQSEAFDLEPGLHAGDVTRGWGELSESSAVHLIPGPHRAVPGRSLEALGRELARLIREAQ